VKWNPEAEKKIKRVPFFVRKMAKNAAEEEARKRGISEITPELIDEVKKSVFKKPEKGANIENEVASLEQIVETAMRAAEELSYKGRFYEVSICGSPAKLPGTTARCPFALVDGLSVFDKAKKALDESGLSQFIENGIEGPVLVHHKFKVAIAGCPNSCSEPQIKDFGIVAVAKPQVTSTECTKCGECVRACPENSVRLTKKGVEIKTEKCLNCARCIMACEQGALEKGETGYKILIGGRLGRRPRLAEELPGIYQEDEVIKILKKLLSLMIERGKPGERSAYLFDRLKISAKEALL
jgi:anaerobic sulfite reductase subunit C